MEIKKKKRTTIADTLRAMKVGDTVFFPFDQYNPNTVRATPGTTLYKERAEGRKWITKTDIFGKRVAVTRVL